MYINKGLCFVYVDCPMKYIPTKRKNPHQKAPQWHIGDHQCVAELSTSVVPFPSAGL